MVQVKLKELNMGSRAEAVSFLKKLWNGEPANCPICGERLEILHKKAKKATVTGSAKTAIRLLKQ